MDIYQQFIKDMLWAGTHIPRAIAKGRVLGMGYGFGTSDPADDGPEIEVILRERHIAAEETHDSQHS